MDLQALFLQTILTIVPPGHSQFSITPVSYIENEEYSGYKWSSFYNSWVRKETKEEGKDRYSVIIDAFIKTAQAELCVDDDLNKIPNCNKNPLLKGWKFIDLVSVAGASMIAESGLREDVVNGRGKSRKPSDDGGQGLGPGGEVCLLQIHPTVLASFKIDPQTFLGLSGEALSNCFSFGMEMFGRSRRMCAYRATKTPQIKHDWVFETFSAYGTGNTCESGNDGKTGYRKSLYKIIYADFSARIRKAKSEENKQLKTSKNNAY